MIEITIKHDAVKIHGHANYDQYGKDIVCAGISALGQTLLLSLEELTEDDYSALCSDGELCIKFRTLSDGAKILKGSFLIGCKAIAECYPDNVRLSTSNYYRQ